MTGLTDKQAETFRFLEAYIADKGIAPTVREVMVGVNVASSARAQEVLVALEERGYIGRIPNRARAIEILRRLPGDDVALPGPAILARQSDHDLHRLRRDLAMEITKRTNDVAIKRADAITGASL